MQDSHQDEFLNYEELCELLKIKKGTAYSLVSRGQIPHLRLSGKIVRFQKRTILEWATGNAKAKPAIGTAKNGGA